MSKNHFELEGTVKGSPRVESKENGLIVKFYLEERKHAKNEEHVIIHDLGIWQSTRFDPKFDARTLKDGENILVTGEILSNTSPKYPGRYFIGLRVKGIEYLAQQGSIPLEEPSSNNNNEDIDW